MVDNYPAGQADSRQEALLVDEVDVFFGKDFYGQTYNQVTQISTPEVVALIRSIWTMHRQNVKPTMRELKRSPEYQSLISKFQDWKYFIDNKLALMCSLVGCSINRRTSTTVHKTTLAI